jgi:prepilin signal peptidase PulO-like enzyme (type II secretory pathway)
VVAYIIFVDIKFTPTTLYTILSYKALVIKCRQSVKSYFVRVCLISTSMCRPLPHSTALFHGTPVCFKTTVKEHQRLLFTFWGLELGHEINERVLSTLYHYAYYVIQNR